MEFPIIADAKREIAQLYGMLDKQDLTNIDQKGLPMTVCVTVDDLIFHAGAKRLYHRSQECYPVCSSLFGLTTCDLA